MALSKKEQETLEALQRKAEEPEQEDFEIEIGSGDKYARVPYSRGRSYLQEHFGIDLDPEAETTDEADATGEGEGSKAKKPAKQSAGNEGTGRTGHWSGRIDRNSA